MLWRRGHLFRAAAVFAAAISVCLLGYLALAVPDAWFPSASPQAWGASELVLASGTGRLFTDELVVTAPDANGMTLVTVQSDLRSTGLAVMEWAATGVPETADVRLVWRSSFAPRNINTVPLRVEYGRPMPVVVARHPAWIGRITGLALAIQGPLAHPLRIHGVAAKPAGALETLHERAAEWFAFETWSGASINTMTGGAEIQPLPLPVLLASIVGLAGGAVALIHRRWPSAFGVAPETIAAAFFLAAWLALDARWSWNLARQVTVTAGQYAGKDARAKHLAAEDGPLYAFIEKSLALMPSSPVRVFVAADAIYYRERAAYHLYPHSVFFDPSSSDLPSTDHVRPGDWLLVYQRHGIQYDASQGKLRWDGVHTVSAEPKLVEPGAALFLIR
jgi:hypothetical protein